VQPGVRRRTKPRAPRRSSTNLARRAYPPAGLDRRRRRADAFYKQARDTEGSFDDGIRAGSARILASPSFLYRIERDPRRAAGAAHTVSDVELASRLSFFLWSSIPDRDAAESGRAGRLAQPACSPRRCAG
jgi:hypothetical protein